MCLLMYGGQLYGVWPTHKRHFFYDQHFILISTGLIQSAVPRRHSPAKKWIYELRDVYVLYNEICIWWPRATRGTDISRARLCLFQLRHDYVKRYAMDLFRTDRLGKTQVILKSSWSMLVSDRRSWIISSLPLWKKFRLLFEQEVVNKRLINRTSWLDVKILSVSLKECKQEDL